MAFLENPVDYVKSIIQDELGDEILGNLDEFFKSGLFILELFEVDLFQNLINGLLLDSPSWSLLSLIPAKSSGIAASSLELADLSKLLGTLIKLMHAVIHLLGFFGAVKSE